MQYGDGQTDDARHTMMVARTAVEHGALVRTSTQVVRLLREIDTQGVERVIGAELRDTETGATCRVQARVIINCTGVWTDDIQHMVSDHVPFRVRASKGIHITVPRERIASDTGLILRTEKSVLFVIPWKDLWLIGTTDTDWHLDLAHPAASSSDIDYVLDHVNAVLVTPLTREDIVSVYAGLRPLLAGESDQTSKLSREHAVSRIMPGLVSIAGGKYTTYRVMARDVIDGAVRQLQNQDAQRLIPPSLTADIPVVGAAGFRELWDQREDLAAEHEVDLTLIEHLLHRHGDRTAVVLDLIAQDSTLGQRLHAEAPYVRAEVVVAVTDEGAQSIEDVLVRRMRLALEVPDGGRAIALATAGLMAPWLDWSESEVEQALNEFASSHRAKVPLAD
jgi:glycerol-3-phosphate dehydrogenase